MSREGQGKPDDSDRLIVELLRAEPAPVSGETLARELGISRVALWKRIQALNAWGYGIRAAHRGYELVHDDGLAPWELQAPGRVLLLAKTGSTMDDAREMARGDAPNGSLAIALEQERGRDTCGGSWLSPPGGLYCSVVLRSALPPSHAGALALEAASTVLALLKSAGAEGVFYRWPNALIAEAPDGKTLRIGGLLLEFEGGAHGSTCFLVGIGINMAAPGLSGLEAGGLRELCAQPPTRARLAVAAAEALARWAARPVLEAGRWAKLAPDPARALRCRLWNGAERIIRPRGFNERGELVAQDGGPALSLGECIEINDLGVAP
jgi:biotin operon repressor BirA-like protein